MCWADFCNLMCSCLSLISPALVAENSTAFKRKVKSLNLKLCNVILNVLYPGHCNLSEVCFLFNVPLERTLSSHRSGISCVRMGHIPFSKGEIAKLGSVIKTVFYFNSNVYFYLHGCSHCLTHTWKERTEQGNEKLNSMNFSLYKFLI